MKKQLAKILVLSAVFIGSLIFFNITADQDNSETVAEMADASLPVIYFTDGDIRINELYGYRQEMDPLGVRDTITPIGDTRRLNFRMDTFGFVPDRIVCEICSLDGSEVLASEGRVDFVMEEDTATAEIAIPGQIEEETEYLMKFTVMKGTEKLYYYTRIVQALDWDAEECIAFADTFHENTFDKSEESYFAAYQSAGGDLSGNYAEVDLDSNTSMLMWGNLEVSEAGEPQISVKEITGYYTSLVISSNVQIQEEDGTVTDCIVEEDFRLRNSQERMYVLDYERHVESIFCSEEDFLTDDGNLILGIRNDEVTYRTNDTGTVTAFVQAGELWSYDSSGNTIARVFSFRTDDLTDLRSNYNAHEIQIARVDEVGNIDFFVCGYMNRGNHEGETGIALYHYDALMYTVEEEAFIPSDSSYTMTISSLCNLLRENAQGNIYLLKDKTLLKVDRSTAKITVVADQLEEDSILNSESGQYLVWSRAGESTIHVLNMVTDQLLQIEESGKELKPFAFLGEDLVYGVTAENSKDSEENGTVLYQGLKIIELSEDRQEVLKSYTPSGCLIGKVTVENDTLKIQLVHESDGRYVSEGTDTILKSAGSEENQISVNRVSTGSRMPDLVELELAKRSTAVKIRQVTPDQLVPYRIARIELPEEEDGNYYYVYTWGRIGEITADPAEAMNTANGTHGVVLDREGNCLWSRARSVSRTAFACNDINEQDLTAGAVTQCFSAMLQCAGVPLSATELLADGKSMKEVLEEELPQAKVYELVGCDAECLLYFVSKGTPVLCMTGTNSAVLMNGYDTDSIYYYDFETGQQCQAKYADMDKLLAAGGQQYLAYEQENVE